MSGQPKPTRNRKIEPLNWAETANSPALKGMMSFLDITPEEVRSGHFANVPSELEAGGDVDSVSRIGSETPLGTGRYSDLSTSLPTIDGAGAVSDSLPASDVPGVSNTHIRIDARTVRDTHPGTGYAPKLPGVLFGSVPSQNRKIRRCAVCQDAHSPGEETLYRVLWEEGKPELADPLGARVVRIGYAELANKARMHKANVRLNLVNLMAKLAIEQTGDFNSRDMIAKSYRVWPSQAIFDRRRAAGLEYVIRKKNVVFVSAAGEPVPIPYDRA